MKMFVSFLHLMNGKISVQSVGFQEPLQRCEETWMEAEGTFLVPCGDFRFSICECSCPQVQQVIATSASFLVPAKPRSEQAQMHATLDVPLGPVLCKLGLKRAGSRVWGQGRPVGPLSNHQDMTWPCFFSDFCCRNQMVNKLGLLCHLMHWCFFG